MASGATARQLRFRQNHYTVAAPATARAVYVPRRQYQHAAQQAVLEDGADEAATAAAPTTSSSQNQTDAEAHSTSAGGEKEQVPQKPGKNQRKKLRRQQEQEAAEGMKKPKPLQTTEKEKMGKNMRKRLQRQGPLLVAADELGEAPSAGPEEKKAVAVVPGKKKKPVKRASKRKTKEAAKATVKDTEARPAREKAKKFKESQKDKQIRAKQTTPSQSDPDSASAGATPSSTPPLQHPPPSDPDAAAPDAAAPDRPTWQTQKRALRAKFPEGWRPRRRLSPDAIEGIRALHQQLPDVYTTPVLASHFAVSPEAIRRILKSRWRARTTEEEEARQARWYARGRQVWARWAALGRKPPKRWQAEGVRRDKSWTGRRKRMTERQLAMEMERDLEGARLKDEDMEGDGVRVGQGKDVERRETP